MQPVPTQTALRADDVALRATCLRRTALHAPGSACGLAEPLKEKLDSTVYVTDLQGL